MKVPTRAAGPSSRQRPLGFSRLRAGLQRRVVEPAALHVSCAIRLRRNRDREFRPVFVAGVMGSGTSLTAALLGQTFECATWINESARQISRRSPLWLDRTERYASVQRYREAIEPQPSWTPALVREELSKLYRSFADGPGDVAIDKGPNTNMTRAPLLAAAFPTGRFVFVFRDPVSNLEGFRRKWANFARDPLARSIDFYREIHETFLDWAEANQVPLQVVEYERFVESPAPVLARMGEACGLRPATTLRKLADKGNEPGGRGIRNVQNSRVGVVTDATKRSYEAMGPEEVDQIRAELGALHRRMQCAAARLHERAAAEPR